MTDPIKPTINSTTPSTSLPPSTPLTSPMPPTIDKPFSAKAPDPKETAEAKAKAEALVKGGYVKTGGEDKPPKIEEVKLESPGKKKGLSTAFKVGGALVVFLVIGAGLFFATQKASDVEESTYKPGQAGSCSGKEGNRCYDEDLYCCDEGPPKCDLKWSDGYYCDTTQTPPPKNNDDLSTRTDGYCILICHWSKPGCGVYKRVDCGYNPGECEQVDRCFDNPEKACETVRVDDSCGDTATPPPSGSPPPTSGLKCKGINASNEAPGVGDSVTFTCTSPAVKVVDHFEFRYKINQGKWNQLTSGTAQSSGGDYSGTSGVLTVPQAGNYKVQCRVCKKAGSGNCSTWGKSK